MRPLLGAALLCAVASIGSGSVAKRPDPAPPPMPPGYDDPGPKPANVLPAILFDLRRKMKDPYSIRDFVLCESEVVRPFLMPGGGEWLPARWKVDFALNARNSYGGYAGATHFTATFRGGALESVASPNLGPELNAKLLGLVQGCPRVPDADVQRLVQSAP